MLPVSVTEAIGVASVARTVGRIGGVATRKESRHQNIIKLALRYAVNTFESNPNVENFTVKSIDFRCRSTTISQRKSSKPPKPAKVPMDTDRRGRGILSGPAARCASDAQTASRPSCDHCRATVTPNDHWMALDLRFDMLPLVAVMGGRKSTRFVFISRALARRTS